MIPILEDIIRGLLDGTMSPEQARCYLAAHEEADKRLSTLADDLPEPTPELGTVVIDAMHKYTEQRERWGLRAYPNFDVELLSNADTDAGTLCGYYGVMSPSGAMLRRNNKANFNELAWFDILLGEVCKLTKHHNESDRQALRAQLVDVIGVSLSWAEALTDFNDFVETTIDAVEPRPNQAFDQPHHGHGDHEGVGAGADA